MQKVVLLDRDGIINEDSWQYIKSVDEFLPIPGSMEAIGRLTRAGYCIGVATNQSGVSRGFYTEEELSAIHNKMIQLARSAGGEINEIVYCIHMPDEACFCRKPNPGMLYTLAERFESTLSKVPFVGDRISDIEAALAFGATPIMVLSPMTDRSKLPNYPSIPVYNSLSDWVSVFLDKKD